MKQGKVFILTLRDKLGTGGESAISVGECCRFKAHSPKAEWGWGGCMPGPPLQTVWMIEKGRQETFYMFIVYYVVMRIKWKMLENLENKVWLLVIDE